MAGPLAAIDRIIDLPQVSQDLARRVRALERRIAAIEPGSEPSGIMMTEAELRRELQDLDEYWAQLIESRGRSDNPLPPADFFWYVYTRQAYQRVLGISTALELQEGRP